MSEIDEICLAKIHMRSENELEIKDEDKRGLLATGVSYPLHIPSGKWLPTGCLSESIPLHPTLMLQVQESLPLCLHYGFIGTPYSLGFRNSSKSEQFSTCILALLGRQRTGIVANMICACYCILHQHVLEGPLLHQRVSLLNWDIRTTAHFFAVSVTL